MPEYITITEAEKMGFCREKCKNATKKDPVCKAIRTFTDVPEGHCVVIKETRQRWAREMKGIWDQKSKMDESPF
jgi:hypothetical protein